MIDPHKPERPLAGRGKKFWSFEMRSLRNVYLAALALLLVFSLVPVAEAQLTRYETKTGTQSETRT